MIKFIEEQEKTMLSGPKNWSVRLYFYATKGMDIINYFRVLGMGILGFCFITKISDPLKICVFFVIAFPIVIFIGYIFVHYMAVVLEFLGVRYTTAWNKYSFELQERQTDACEKLVKLLEEKK